MKKAKETQTDMKKQMAENMEPEVQPDGQNSPEDEGQHWIKRQRTKTTMENANGMTKIQSYSRR